MKKTFILAIAAFFATIITGHNIPAAAVPASGPIRGANARERVKNQYIVVLKENATRSGASSRAATLSKDYGGTLRRTFSRTINGFVINLSERQAMRLAAHPAVKYVEQDATVSGDATQLNPNAWGIDRIDQANLPLSASYTYPNTASSVTAYVIDSGVRTTHTEFGTRASYGYDFVDNDSVADDCHGHGTNVAGIIGSSSYGVAKDINLVSVRVLNCSNTGYYSDIIAGIDWVTANATLPAVANLSLGGTTSTTLDSAVQNSINAGITYAISAGNTNSSACFQSPARVTAAITVAATDDTDTRWASSNYGSCVDVFAPGVLIRSPYYSSNTATARMTGTSQATPHVTGVAAIKLQSNPTWTPAQVHSSIVSGATSGVITDPGTNSPNKLLRL